VITFILILLLLAAIFGVLGAVLKAALVIALSIALAVAFLAVGGYYYLRHRVREFRRDLEAQQSRVVIDIPNEADPGARHPRGELPGA